MMVHFPDSVPRCFSPDVRAALAGICSECAASNAVSHHEGSLVLARAHFTTFRPVIDPMVVFRLHRLPLLIFAARHEVKVALLSIDLSPTMKSSSITGSLSKIIPSSFAMAVSVFSSV